MKLTELSAEGLHKRHAELSEHLDAIKSRGLNLDLTRGKPATDQLDLSSSLDGILEGFYILQDGTDVRNYGGILGIPEARALGADFLDLPAEQVLAGGNSSLNLMYLYVNFLLDWGTGTQRPWSEEISQGSQPAKFLCPVPGYDRHFTVCEHFGIEMVPVPFDDEGPDMDAVESAVRADGMIKGMWCIPKYSNPTGHTYSDKTVARIAGLPAIAGKGFTVFWDNAYAIHTLEDAPAPLANLMTVANGAGTAANVVLFASTSKVTFAGAGVAFMGATVANLAAFEKFLSASVIGFDKVNQLRHVRFLKDKSTTANLMQAHRHLIAPKFELVEQKLKAGLGGKGIANWTHPEGGYFVSLDTLPGLATKTVALARDVGVKLTPAGATFPGGHDPQDTNIRIAPTYPPIGDLNQALDVLVVCTELAAVGHLIEQCS